MLNLKGKDLGRYHLIEPLGEGGMVMVYKAYDATLDRNVAIKVIRTEMGGDPSFLLRFQREAKALARLDHPYILKVLDYGEQDGLPYLVMPFVAGGTLKARMGQPISPAETARILAPIARALAYAHSQGIIHRDVKPANILITPSGAPTLSDFGIAKMLEGEGKTQLTATGVGMGTPDYMAPEQWLGTTDARTDVYALGVILFQMITGRLPYSADTPAAVLLKHMQDPLPRPGDFVPGLAEAVERVIFKALAKESTGRFQTMDAFAEALEKLSAGVEQSPDVTMAAPPTGTSPAAYTGQPADLSRQAPAAYTGQPADLSRQAPAAYTGQPADLSRQAPAAYTGQPADLSRQAPAANTGQPADPSRQAPAAYTGQPADLSRQTAHGATPPAYAPPPAGAGQAAAAPAKKGLPWLMIGGGALALLVVLCLAAALVVMRIRANRLNSGPEPTSPPLLAAAPPDAPTLAAEAPAGEPSATAAEAVAAAPEATGSATAEALFEPLPDLTPTRLPPITKIEGLPDDIPILKENNGDLMKQESAEMTMYMYTTTLSTEAAASFFKDEMGKLGWTIQNTTTMEAQEAVMYVFEKDARMVMINIAGADNQTMVMVQLVPQSP